MTFKQLQDEMIALRFDESDRNSLKFWLNLRYTALWQKADWHFKHVKGAALAVVGGDPTPAMPSDFAKAEQLFDNYGCELRYLEPDQWRDLYLDTTIGTATPSYDYTVIDREIWIGPTPGGSATYTLSYLRRLAHLDGGTGLPAPGVMVADNDEPLWEAEYDYVIAVDATILGQQLNNDPTWRDLVPQRDELLGAMMSDLTSGITQQTGRIWGE